MTRPHRATILSVDPGAQAGVALFLRGTLTASAQIDTASNLVEWWVNYALDQSIQRGETLVMVGESWGRGGPMGMKQWQGLGGAWAVWKRALKQAWKRAKENGHRQPAPKVVTVHVARWRSKIFGGRVPKGMSKQLAVQAANQRFGLELGKEEHDRAEACLLGFYATMAPEVLAVIPERFRETGVTA